MSNNKVGGLYDRCPTVVKGPGNDAGDSLIRAKTPPQDGSASGYAETAR